MLLNVVDAVLAGNTALVVIWHGPSGRVPILGRHPHMLLGGIPLWLVDYDWYHLL